MLQKEDAPVERTDMQLFGRLLGELNGKLHPNLLRELISAARELEIEIAGYSWRDRTDEPQVAEYLKKNNLLNPGQKFLVAFLLYAIGNLGILQKEDEQMSRVTEKLIAIMENGWPETNIRQTVGSNEKAVFDLIDYVSNAQSLDELLEFVLTDCLLAFPR
ncbi:hypothetical protein KBC79_04645 [Candidatus Woesebacteria bacterium]|nr:hypothetical protein [Candidatus Woesebacteria bacterium]